MTIVFLVLFLTGIIFCFLELNHRLRSSSPLLLNPVDFEIKSTDLSTEINVLLKISNPHPHMEIMIPEFRVIPRLMGSIDMPNVKIRTNTFNENEDPKYRRMKYYCSHIVKAKQSTNVQVSLRLDDYDIRNSLNKLYSIWLEIFWVNYGPFGRIERNQGIVIPTCKLKQLKSSDAYFIKGDNCQILPLKTHILGPLDNPIEIINNYTAHIYQKGDIITIGETPLALMEGRYRNPKEINPSLLAKLLCKAFHPTSSLATGCGMQTLIDIIGPTRTIISWVSAIFLKCLGVKGVFYRLAGKQARLIDDITGTTPPYDKSIVLGPENPENFCNTISKELGIDIAVVDVNDLGRVKILAASSNCDKRLIRQALSTNPAGNADQLTPLVLVRPS